MCACFLDGFRWYSDEHEQMAVIYSPVEVFSFTSGSSPVLIKPNVDTYKLKKLQPCKNHHTG